MVYYVAADGDNRNDGLDHDGDIHYLRTIQKAIDLIVLRAESDETR